MNVCCVGTYVQFSFERLDKLFVPFLYDGSWKLRNEEVEVSEAACEQVCCHYALFVAKGGLSDAVTDLMYSF